MIAGILDACRDQLCDCATFRTLVGAANPIAARASVVRLERSGAPLTVAHAVLDRPRIRWTPGSRLMPGEATVECSITFPPDAGLTGAALETWAVETIGGPLALELGQWADERVTLLAGLEIEPPVLLDLADDLPAWFVMDVVWTWKLAA